MVQLQAVQQDSRDPRAELPLELIWNSAQQITTKCLLKSIPAKQVGWINIGEWLAGCTVKTYVKAYTQWGYGHAKALQSR